MSKPVDLQQLRKEYSEEEDRLQQRLAKLRVALTGIDAALEIEYERVTELHSPSPSTPSVPVQQPPNTIKSIILAQALQQPGKITAPNLFEDMRMAGTDRGIDYSTVSHALRAGAEKGLLKIVERGAGKRATVYERVNAPLDFSRAVSGTEFSNDDEGDGAEISGEVSAP